MKKIILLTCAILVSLAGSLDTYAQGSIAFADTSVTQRILDGTTGLPLFGPAGTYEYGLYIGSAGSTAAQLTLVGTTLNPASSSATFFTAGLFNGGAPYHLPSVPGVTLDGTVPIAFMIKCWLAADGSSLEAAYAAGGSRFGWSTIGSVTPAVGPDPFPYIFGTAPGQIQAFSFGGILELPPLSIVPEPSTIALATLGTIALLRFRRRG